MSKRNQAVVEAYKKGYRVKNGRVFGPLKRERKLFIQSGLSPYLCFTIRVNGVSQLVPVHRLVAFQKFQKDMFRKDMMVRHLNGDRFMNRTRNIQLGTAKDNASDRKRV